MNQKLDKPLNYQDGSIVSKEIMRKNNGTVTVFAFDKGQRLSEHSTPYDAIIQVVDGIAEINLNKTCYELSRGDYLQMQAGSLHEVYAKEKFKMILIMIK